MEKNLATKKNSNFIWKIIDLVISIKSAQNYFAQLVS